MFHMCFMWSRPCETILTIFGKCGHRLDEINFAKVHLDLSKDFGVAIEHVAGETHVPVVKRRTVIDCQVVCWDDR